MPNAKPAVERGKKQTLKSEQLFDVIEPPPIPGLEETPILNDLEDIVLPPPIPGMVEVKTITRRK